MAAGVPVLASDIGGLPEHIEHDRNGLLVGVDAVGEWATAIARLRDDDLSRSLGDAAFQTWHARFSPQVALSNLEALYLEWSDARLLSVAARRNAGQKRFLGRAREVGAPTHPNGEKR